MKATDIKRDIEQLSVRERASLARWIIINLGRDGEGENIIDAAWRREVRTRIDEVKSGKVKMIPSEGMWKDLLTIVNDINKMSLRAKRSNLMF